MTQATDTLNVRLIFFYIYIWHQGRWLCKRERCLTVSSFSPDILIRTSVSDIIDPVGYFLHNDWHGDDFDSNRVFTHSSFFFTAFSLSLSVYVDSYLPPSRKRSCRTLWRIVEYCSPTIKKQGSQQKTTQKAETNKKKGNNKHIDKIFDFYYYNTKVSVKNACASAIADKCSGTLSVSDFPGRSLRAPTMWFLAPHVLLHSTEEVRGNCVDPPICLKNKTKKKKVYVLIWCEQTHNVQKRE